jgi:hypothetical protein
MTTLSKAIAEIKFPVRYLEESRYIIDSDNEFVLRISLRMTETNAFGEKMAELINELNPEKK